MEAKEGTRAYLCYHPIHVASTVLNSPSKIGVLFIILSRGEGQSPAKPVMSPADECGWNGSLESPNGGAPNDCSLAIEIGIVSTYV